MQSCGSGECSLKNVKYFLLYLSVYSTLIIISEVCRKPLLLVL